MREQIAEITLGVCGALLIFLGLLVMIKQKISVFHYYHYDRVAREERIVFCYVSGAGLTVMGLGFLSCAIIMWLSGSLYGLAALAAGLAVGLFLLIFASMKYNR